MAVDGIKDFPNLYPRQVGWMTYAVLHMEDDDENTAYLVRLDELACDCPDAANNREDPEICKHVAVALYEASKEIPAEAHALEESSDLVRETSQSVQELLTVIRDRQAGQAAGPAENGTEAPDEAERQADQDPEGALMSILEDKGISPENLNVWIDDEYGSLQFRADEMDNNEFSTFRNWCQGTDGVNWDRDNSRNYIKSDDFEEVLG